MPIEDAEIPTGDRARRQSRRRLLKIAATLTVAGSGIAALASAMMMAGASRPNRRGPTVAAPRTDLDGWLRDHDRRVARAMTGRDRLLFLGDSLTLGWQGDGGPPYAGEGLRLWRRLYAPRGAAIAAVGADRVEHLLWRVRHGEVAAKGPEALVVLIGSNNIGIDPPGAIAKGISAVVAELRRRSPEASVLLMALPPRGPGSSDVAGLDRVRPDPDVARVNRLLAPLDRLPMVQFVPFGDRLLDPDGFLPRSVSPDFLHYRRAAYEAWAMAIEPTIRLLLGPPPPSPGQFDGSPR